MNRYLIRIDTMSEDGIRDLTIDAVDLDAAQASALQAYPNGVLMGFRPIGESPNRAEGDEVVEDDDE